MSNTKTNARRGRPMVTITLARESIETIDRRRGKMSRGEYIELVVKLCPVVADAWMRTRAVEDRINTRRRVKP